MSEIAEIMGAVTNCAVAGIQAGRDIGKAERGRLQSQLDGAVALLRTAGRLLHEHDSASTMYGDQCGYVAEQIDKFIERVK
jgi:hypothetical protein